MSSAMIGALNVSLGIDTAAFSDGLKNATKDLKGLGSQMQSIGRSLSTKISAPIIAAAGGIAAGAFKMSEGLVELRNQAAIANTTVEDFQRLAAAARTVGIENEKLANILKDTNDKIGDFAATGGGEMADFFENIAPAAGLTAEALQAMPGPDALLAIVNALEGADLSQSQLTFYLESIADEATALLPLLRNNGAELRRLGDEAESFGLASEDQVQSAVAFQEAMNNLKQSFTGLGLALADAGLTDAITSIVEKVADFTKSLQDIDPRIVKFGALFAGLAAAVGPVLIGIGALVAVAGTLAAPLLAAGAAVAAVTAAVVAFGPELTAAKDAVISFGTEALDWITAKVEEIPAIFRVIPETMGEIGIAIIEGLWQGITGKWEELKANVSGLASGIADRFKDALGIQSPSRVFAEIGVNVMEGLGQGIGSMAGNVTGQVEGMADKLSSLFADVLFNGADFVKGMQQILQSTGMSLANKAIGMGLSAIGIPGIPAYARGTNFHPGGLALVGERGPELVDLPRGARVTPNNEIGGGTEVHIHNHIGAKVETERRRGPNGQELFDIHLREALARGAADAPLRGRFGVGPAMVKR